MAKVNSCIIRFPPSASPDVTGYKLYVAMEPNVLNYSSQSYALGNPSPGGDGLIPVDLSLITGLAGLDGAYNIGVSAVDDAGNESSMSVKNGVQIDFIAPDPPGDVIVVRG